jgi:hypothetical protein
MSNYDRSHLINGRFIQNLNGWTGAGGASYLASDGDEHYGLANLPVGASISQAFSVDNPRAFSLHIAAKSPSGALTAGQAVFTITDGQGNTVLTSDLVSGITWTETIYTLGLGPGATYTITLTNVSAPGDVRIDDVWLWFVPVTRTQIAARVHAKLGRIAQERSFSTVAAGLMTEGSYTYAIDAALGNVGAIDPETGNPDVRYLNDDNVQSVTESARHEMLEQLQSDYAVEVDTRTGPFSQSLSQKRAAITEMLGGGDASSSGGGIIQRRMSCDD